jgi:isochorismate hydrolase
MLSVDRAVLMIVDVQGKLAQLMHDKERLFRNLRVLIKGAQALRIPILWLEQNPGGLGPTIPEVAELLVGLQPMAKMTFSACGAPGLLEALRASARQQVILAGIEAHVCIYLTAAELLAKGYTVEVVADAVSSRSLENKEIGLRKAAALSAGISSTETVLFELLQRADVPEFKELIGLVK